LLQSLRRVEFIPAPSPDTPDCFVSFAGPHAPTLVTIHGISRNAAEMATRFALHAGFAEVNIITPLFERSHFGKYQLMQTRKAQKTNSGQALFNLLQHFEAQGEIGAGKVMLFGFSGGAQMAHRLAMLYPERVSRLCAASAGWYLLPDRDLPYPYGLGEGCPVAVTDGFLDVPTTVLVGSRDTRIDASVRQDPVIVQKQGRHRRQRADTWVRLMTDQALARNQAPNVKLVTLENVSHDFGLCVREANLLDHAAAALLL
jgi:dienelactone hydrolase